MRILELAMYSPDFLGSFGDSLLSLGRELKNNGDYMVVCFPEPKEWLHMFELEGFGVEIFHMKNILPAVRVLSTLIKKYKIDIIHTHFGLETQVIACLAKFISSPGQDGVKIVWHWRNPPHTDALLLDVGASRNIPLQIKRVVGNFGYRFLNTTCVSANIAISREIQNILYKRKLRNVRIIYNGIDLAKYNPENTTYNSQVPLIGNISNFRTQKDHWTFLESAKLVLQKYPNIKFLLVGDGPTRPKVYAYAQKLGITNNLIFTGMQQDVRSFIKKCNFTVLSSLHEGFGNVICESMALKKPVIATDVGGIPEIVKDGENGFLVPRKNPAIMAEKILYLIEHPEKVNQLGKNGRKLVEEKFTIQRWVKEIIETFLEILNS